MELPILATEQYPKGLGPTVPELGLVEANIKPYAKTCFSMCAVPGKYLELSLTLLGIRWDTFIFLSLFPDFVS